MNAERLSKMAKIGRNQPCPCGSGLKYKKCCATKEAKTPIGLRIVAAVVAVFLIGGLVVFLTNIDDYDASATPGPGRVWSEEHGHWH